MNAWLSNASLLLYPQSPAWVTESPTLLKSLLNIGLVADSFEPNAYYTGEQFLDHIAFMGCAPNIQLAPEADSDSFSHIRIHLYESITALIGKHARAPGCPQCNKAFEYSPTQLDALDADSQWTCPHCQHLAAPWQYRWRKSAGFARVFIEITEIYPKEAIPQDSLLEALHADTGTQWQYCYLF